MNTIIIRKLLESDIVELGKEVEPLVGKNVETIIREVADAKLSEKKWTTIGSVDLGGDLDFINIRDFAHDD